jgi:hypothetical protein
MLSHVIRKRKLNNLRGTDKKRKAVRRKRNCIKKIRMRKVLKYVSPEELNLYFNCNNKKNIRKYFYSIKKNQHQEKECVKGLRRNLRRKNIKLYDEEGDPIHINDYIEYRKSCSERKTVSVSVFKKLIEFARSRGTLIINDDELNVYFNQNKKQEVSGRNSDEDSSSDFFRDLDNNESCLGNNEDLFSNICQKKLDNNKEIKYHVDDITIKSSNFEDSNIHSNNNLMSNFNDKKYLEGNNEDFLTDYDLFDCDDNNLDENKEGNVVSKDSFISKDCFEDTDNDSVFGVSDDSVFGVFEDDYLFKDSLEITSIDINKKSCGNGSSSSGSGSSNFNNHNVISSTNRFIDARLPKKKKSHKKKFHPSRRNVRVFKNKMIIKKVRRRDFERRMRLLSEVLVNSMVSFYFRIFKI